MRKRLRAAAAGLVFMLVSAVLPAAVLGKDFKDVSVMSSYYTAVNKLSESKIMVGRSDDIFAPNDNIKRAEVCAVLARANDYSESQYNAQKLPFSDVSNDSWAKGYISFCYENGYVNGMSEDSFMPDGYITREQAIKMVVCASGVGDEALAAVGPKWYSGYINKASKEGLLNGTELEPPKKAESGKTPPQARFDEGEYATRQFVAQVTFNSMLVKGSGKTENITVAQASQDTPADAYEEEIWMPSQDDEAWRYYQYYGEDYEEYIKEEQNEKDYTVPEETAGESVIEYVPRGSSDGMLVVIDPGHNYNGVDTGAVGNGLREQDITFYIAEKLKPLLERNGFDVIMTRNSLKENVSNESVSASLARRADIANRNGADLFLSIHCNAGGGTGIETYYCTGSDSGRILADYIQTNVVDEIGIRDRGVKSARYAVLRNTNMAAALLETAFIDTASDAAILGNPEYQQRYAEAIARGICDYVGIEYK